jgi:hypothetical protein
LRRSGQSRRKDAHFRAFQQDRAAPMHQVVDKLDLDDMLAIAAYLGSRAP